MIDVLKNNNNRQNSQSINIEESKTIDKQATSIIEKYDNLGKYKNPVMAYQEALFERKRIAYKTFRNWEEKRASLLSQHSKLMEIIIYKLEQRCNFGLESLDIIIRFFKERVNQEEVYQKLMNVNIPKLGIFFNEKRSNEGIITKAFKEFDNYHIKHMKNSQEIMEFITFSMLNETFEWFLKDYSKNIETLKIPISEKRKKLIKMNKEVNEKAIEYNDFCQKNFKNETQDKSKDFYKYEAEFFRLANYQNKLEAELGKEVMEFFDNIKKIEIKRLDIMKRGLIKYMNKMGELYGKNGSNNPEIVCKLFETLNINENIDKFFNVNTFFETEDEIKLLKALYPNINEITITQMRNFIESFEYNPPNKSLLSVKEWRVSRDLGLMKGIRHYKAILTVDFNIVLVEINDEIKKAEKIIKISDLNLLLNDNKDTEIVEFIETIHGLIIDSKNKITLKFECSDAADEFINFIKHYEILKNQI